LLPAHALPPVILRPPVSQHVDEGSYVRFSSSSPPIPPVGYQWFRNGKIIPGASSANYELYNVGPLDRGGYQVRIETESAATWSQEVELEIAPQGFRPGMIDTSFSVGSVNGSEIMAIAPAPDGDFYLGGTFERISGQDRANFARVHADGSLDHSFNPIFSNANTDPAVHAIAVDSENRIIVGGNFSHCNGQARQNIARLHPDGSLDHSFNPGANNEINSILLDQENRILIGGTFTNFDSTEVSRLVRLHSNGSLDSSFTNQQTFDASVEEIIRYGSNYYIAGGFTERIIRLNSSGSRDLSFDSYQPRSAVTDIATLPDGALIAAGRFSGGLIKIEATGVRDEDFSPRPNDFILDIRATEEGQILVAGDFTRIAGKSIRSLARLSINGDLDDHFRPPSFDGPVSTLKILGDKVLVGGDFERPHRNLLQLLLSPPVPAPSAPVIVSQPRSREIWPGSRVVLGVGLADSFGMSYQWFHNEAPVTNANSPTLALRNFEFEQTGGYHVIVSREGFSTTSEVARLSLAPATGLAPRAQFESSPQQLNPQGITLATIPVPSSFLIARIRPHLEITHPKINDLTITLEGPDGTKVVLYDRDGRRGNHLNTTFDSFAPADLDDGAAPWPGTWKPHQNLNAFSNRLSAGTWTLEIRDPSGSVNGGSLDLFRLELIAQDPEVNSSNWLNTNPVLNHLRLGQNGLLFTHYRWRNAPSLTYQYQSLQGNSWVPFSPTLLYHENLGNNQDALQLRLPDLNYSRIIRVRLESE